MSDSDSTTVRPVRSIAPMLMLGTLLTLTAMMLPRMHVRERALNDYVPQAAPVETVAAAPQQEPQQPKPRQPTAFDREAAMSPSQLMNRWDDLIDEASRKFHVPKAWIRAVMQRESGGRTMMAADRPIVSSAGAQGLMQVQPDTYVEMAAQYRLGSDPFNPRDNIFAGAAYLRWLHKRYGFPAMFAAYNAGPGRLEDHLRNGASLPAETRAYVSHIAGVVDASVVDGRVPARKGILVKFTRPDGRAIRIDASKVEAIRAPLPGEYEGDVESVIEMGGRYQAIRETLEIARSAVRAVGGLSDGLS